MDRTEAVTARADVANLYRLVLRREVEGEAAILPNLGLPLAYVVRQFYTSGEFIVLARGAIDQGSFTPLVVEVPPPDLYADIIDKLGLDAETQNRIRSASNYIELHYYLLKACVDAKIFDYDLNWLEQAEAGKALPRGEVWGSDGQAVAGWVMPTSHEAGPVRVEVWHEGKVLASGLADRFDHRCLDRCPDYPNSCFWIVIPQADQDRELKLEIRDASRGNRLGELVVKQAAFDRWLIGQFEQKLDKINSEVESLKSDLPRMGYQTAIPIENYGQFYERWLKQPFDHPLYTNVEALVILQTEGADPVDVEAAAHSVLAQSHPRLRLALLTSPKDQDLYSDFARRLSIEVDSEVTVSLTDQVPTLEGPGLVVFLSGQTIAHFDLVAAAAAYFEVTSGKDAVYFDEDCLAEQLGWSVERGHTEPRFKPDFDLDLLMQTPYIGAAIAVRAEVWSQIVQGGFNLSAQGASQIALKLDGIGKNIGHWPIVMTSWVSAAVAQIGVLEWRDEVKAYLQWRDWEARVEPAVDLLGASTDGRCRVVWSIPAKTKASVIIPTRDGLELLKPCVESIFSHSAHNQTEMELIIVDHESRDPQVLAYLNELAQLDAVRVLPHEGPFNWALKNNRAADVATGDVLVFLNNDTLVLSPSWLDELVAQALRPGVGAVGCRLVYPDGSLQHGGFVAAPRPEGFLGHEGLFQPGRVGGYLGRYTVVRQATAVTGACMAVSARCFRELGGFESAAFPVDGNDVDFCFRVRNLGYRVLYTPFTTLYHLESKSRNLSSHGNEHKSYLSASLRLWKKWGLKYGRDPYYNSNFDRTMVPFSRLSGSARLS